MPYGRSGYAPYLAMRDLSNTLYSGLSSIGQQKIQAEDRSFNRMLQENQLGRQTEADVRAREIYKAQLPGMKMKEREDTHKLEWGEGDLTFTDLFPDLEAAQHAINISSKDPSGKNLVQKLEELHGVKYDVDEKSPTRGKFVRKDTSTPMKRFELGPKWQATKELIAVNTDPIKTTQSQVYRWMDSLAALKQQGAKDNDPKVIKLTQDIEKGQ